MLAWLAGLPNGSVSRLFGAVASSPEPTGAIPAMVLLREVSVYLGLITLVVFTLSRLPI